MNDSNNNLELITENIRHYLTSIDVAREEVLPLCRDTIRNCSHAIRAIHRHEFNHAEELIQKARNSLELTKQYITKHNELGNTGFIKDAQKEFAEANITYSLVTGERLPGPEELGIEPVPYLNGLGESVGELRRYLLDSIRQEDTSQCEELLSTMDNIYGILVTIDFPDAITGGLRRTTDSVRGILEKTRSDLTLILQQNKLEIKLRTFEDNINKSK
jgi:translin